MDYFDEYQKKLQEHADFPVLQIILENGDTAPYQVEDIISSYPYHGAKMYYCANYTYGRCWIGKMTTICNCCGKHADCYITAGTKRDLQMAIDLQIKNGIPSPL